MSLEISCITNDQQNINLTSQCIKNWPYELKDYSLKKLYQKENIIRYKNLSILRKMIRIKFLFQI